MGTPKCDIIILQKSDAKVKGWDDFFPGKKSELTPAGED